MWTVHIQPIDLMYICLFSRPYYSHFKRTKYMLRVICVMRVCVSDYQDTNICHTFETCLPFVWGWKHIIYAL